jgi:hypothetical protein
MTAAAAAAAAATVLIVTFTLWSGGGGGGGGGGAASGGGTTTISSTMMPVSFWRTTSTSSRSTLQTTMQRRLGSSSSTTVQQIPRYPTYHMVPMNDLGGSVVNMDAVIGNPLRGIMPSPDFRAPMEYYNETGVPHSLEFYYIGWNSVLLYDPNILPGGMANACDWIYLERILQASQARSCHAVLRFYIHYLGRPLEVPNWLLARNIALELNRALMKCRPITTTNCCSIPDTAR